MPDYLRLNFPGVFPLSFCLLLIGLFMGGCAAPDLDLSLKPENTWSSGEAALPVVIGVDRFVDQRPLTRGSDNQKWRGLIPGVLWIDIASDMPEIYTPFSPYNSLPLTLNTSRSIAGMLREAGLAKEIVYLPDQPYREVEYRLEGDLVKSRVMERGYYYGSFMYAWLTRIVGLPYVSYEIELKVKLRLRAMATGQVVWRGEIAGIRHDKYHSVYDLAAGRDGKHLIAANFSEIIAGRSAFLLAGIRQSLVNEEE